MTFNPSPLPILTQYGVRLIPAGRDSYRCACPVHAGDHPSMSVRVVPNGPRRGRWALTCFACGFHGDTVRLFATLAGLDVKEAYKRLAREQGHDGRADARSPVQLHKRAAAVLACSHNGCGATLEAEGRTYKCPGAHGYLWETSPTFEVLALADRLGWEVGAEAVGAVCDGCQGLSSRR